MEKFSHCWKFKLERWYGLWQQLRMQVTIIVKKQSNITLQKINTVKFESSEKSTYITEIPQGSLLHLVQSC